jgi:N-acetyl-gamma-glutamyl-phosphate reductase
MFKIFIDGQEGTTGLQIHQRLKDQPDLQLLEIDPQRRKDASARAALLNEADLVITCLPDAAAIEAAALVSNDRTRIVDPSTAHRTAEGWVYGMPELEPGQRDKIRRSRRVSVPGCHATGFVSIVRPLTLRGVVPADYPMVAHSLTGYSGGGKKLIATYEGGSNQRPVGPRPYALALAHKHLPEMKRYAGLDTAPLFEPVVADFYQGMLVSVGLTTRLLPGRPTPADVHRALSEHYAEEPFVRVLPLDMAACTEDGFMSPVACNGTNRLDLAVFGHDEQILVIARLDNLGKGASGAAVQAMNLMLGRDEGAGLAIS